MRKRVTIDFIYIKLPKSGTVPETFIVNIAVRVGDIYEWFLEAEGYVGLFLFLGYFCQTLLYQK